MSTLNGATLTQGATQPFTLTLNNPTADHPLNPSGFNTANYQLCFIAKQSVFDADNGVTVINLANSRFTASSDGLTAEYSLQPSDTNTIAINRDTTYTYEIWIEDSTAPTLRAYPIENGSFTLKKSVKD
ncbi:MAG: hypothetical protein AAGD25_06975 [Cyanobacteria bacterium P01_F01_bin.150]